MCPAPVVAPRKRRGAVDRPWHRPVAAKGRRPAVGAAPHAPLGGSCRRRSAVGRGVGVLSGRVGPDLRRGRSVCGTACGTTCRRRLRAGLVVDGDHGQPRAAGWFGGVDRDYPVGRDLRASGVQDAPPFVVPFANRSIHSRVRCFSAGTHSKAAPGGDPCAVRRRTLMVKPFRWYLGGIGAQMSGGDGTAWVERAGVQMNRTARLGVGRLRPTAAVGLEMGRSVARPDGRCHAVRPRVGHTAADGPLRPSRLGTECGLREVGG